MKDVYDRIRLYLPHAKAQATKAGTASPLWDAVLDAEALLADKDPAMRGSRDDVAHWCADQLSRFTQY